MFIVMIRNVSHLVSILVLVDYEYFLNNSDFRIFHCFIFNRKAHALKTCAFLQRRYVNLEIPR